MLAPSISMASEAIEYNDPSGDDDGPGSYLYPTDRVYTRGSFDLREMTITFDDDVVEIRLELSARIEDPWRSEEWGGNGFSLQFLQVYLDTDPTSGHRPALPGMNVQFPNASAWDQVILVSPQNSSRLQSEIAEKAAALADNIIIPTSTRVQGRTLISRVERSALGNSSPETWGVQVLVQSNEGYPSASDLLTRPVNEFEGAHRFGGGSDYNCDPHVIDLLSLNALGNADEIASQHQVLSAYQCDEQGEGIPVEIPMIYRNR
jgi:carbohydrate-binding DOMON domain-containing protein